jgi:hypothetical protein
MMALELACRKSFRLIYYYPDLSQELPSDWNQSNTIIHGHFVRWKDHEVEQMCPDVCQYMTILRDPFDLCVSAYFYGLKQGYVWATSMSLEDFLTWWLEQDFGPLLGALPDINVCSSIKEYCEQFIYIGLVHRLHEHNSVISRILGVQFGQIPMINTSSRTMPIPDLRREFKIKHYLDYELFNYVCSGSTDLTT